jgi:hypothetical protein
VLNDLVKQLVSVLRYFAPSAVGIATVLLANDYQKVVCNITNLIMPWNISPSLWLIVGLIAIQGIAVYYAHRTIFHPIITWFFVRIHTCVIPRIKNEEPEIAEFIGKFKIGRKLIRNDQLHFARWERRGAAGQRKALSIQNELDGANAAGHFFYCSAWSSLLFAWILRLSTQDYDSISLIPWKMFIVFLVLGFWADFRTTRWDIKAYKEL